MLVVKRAAEGKEANGRLVVNTSISNPSEKGLERLARDGVVVQRNINHKEYNSVMKITLPKQTKPGYFFTYIEEVDTPAVTVKAEKPAKSVLDKPVMKSKVEAQVTSPEFVPPKDLMHAHEEVNGEVLTDPFADEPDIVAAQSPGTQVMTATVVEWTGEDTSINDSANVREIFIEDELVDEAVYAEAGSVELVQEVTAALKAIEQLEHPEPAMMTETPEVVAESHPVMETHADAEEGTIKRSPSFMKTENVRIVAAAKSEGYLTSTNRWLHDIIMEKVKEVEAKTKKSHP